MKLQISSELELPISAVTETFAILAKRGVGKSYTGCVMVEEMLKHGQQVVVADPIGVWWGLRSSADGRLPGFPIIVFGGEHGDIPLEENAGEIVAKAIIENGFSAVLDLSLFRKAAQNRFMLAFAETLYRINRKPLHFMVDEADEFAPQRPLHGNERLLGAFEDIVRRGRARGLGVTLITQRAAVLNKNVLTQIEVLVVLRTISPQDRAAIEAWTEIHGTPDQLEQLASTMASLPVGTAWFWSPGWLNIFKKIKVRAKYTFDSSATPKVGEVVVKPKMLAPVDLEQLGDQIKATAEQVKANDPTELKREVAKLRAQLAKVKPEVEAKEVPMFTVKERAKLTEILDDLTKLSCGLETIRSSLEYHKEKWDQIQPVMVAIKDLMDGKIVKREIITPVKIEWGSKPVRNIAPYIPPNPGPSNGDISGGLKRMLIALAQRSPLTKRQLGVRAGLSSSSGTFGTYLGKLRSSGWIDGNGDNLTITPQGVTSLGNYQPLPTGQELLNYWLSELGESGAGRMLNCLAIYYPKSMSKQQLGDVAQISHTSGTFGTYLGKLRTLELIEGRGELRASKEFFE